MLPTLVQTIVTCVSKLHISTVVMSSSTLREEDSEQEKSMQEELCDPTPPEPLKAAMEPSCDLVPRLGENGDPSD